MRDTVGNGSMAQNGSSSTSHEKTSNSMNGTHSHNGNSSLKNGQTKPRPTYFGHDKEEITRLCLQALSDFGFSKTVSTLCEESGYHLESPSVTTFRDAILQGQWDEAENLLFGDEFGDGESHRGLTEAEGLIPDVMLFCLRKQKFLELLESRNTAQALYVLRTELQPLRQDIPSVNFLSSLVMIQRPEELRRKAGWDGAQGDSRRQLLSTLSQYISPAVMLPEHRLAVLLQQVKQHQISQCLYHWVEKSPSLYCDHLCDKNQFPLSIVHELDPHVTPSCQFWFVKFSNNGTMLAGGTNTNHCYIYDVETWDVICTLDARDEPNQGTTYVSWSPDDSMLVTCTLNNSAKLWRSDGTLLTTLPHWDQPVTSCVWLDNNNFITGSLSKNRSLCQWNLRGEQIYDWRLAARITGLAISREYLVAVDYAKHIQVFDIATKQLRYEMDMKMEMTSLNISQDGKAMLVSLKNGLVKLIDIETREAIRTWTVARAGHFVIQSSFGGANESFVNSGSEDGHIYIWHKDNGSLIAKLEAHSSGCCNSVSWNPTDPCMFASGGDDHKIKIWSNTPEHYNGSV